MRANSVEDVLNSIPVLFGFVPKESLIGVSLVGPRRRLGFRMRIDLPTKGQMAAAVRMIADRLFESGASEFLIICLSERVKYAELLVSQVVETLGSERVPLAIWATNERWWTAAEPGGRTWRENPQHPIRVAAVSEGMVIHPTRDSLENEFTHRCLPDRSCWRPAVSEPDLAPNAVDPDKSLTMIRRYRAKFANQGVVRLEEARDIAAALESSSVRDAICAAVRSGDARTELTWWANVSSHLCGPERARPLSVAAFCAWLAGDGVRARIAVDAALQVDGSYQLALLLGAVLDAAIGPDGWAA